MTPEQNLEGFRAVVDAVLKSNKPAHPQSEGQIVVTFLTSAMVAMEQAYAEIHHLPSPAEPNA